MWKAVPRSWFTWNFEARDDSGTPVGEVNISSWRRKGSIECGGFEYLVSRQGPGGAFLLEKSGVLTARAEKPRPLFRSFDIEFEGRTFTLKARFTLRRDFVLTENGAEIGTLAPEGAFVRRAAVDLPEALPPVLRLFVVWLTLFLWKREAEASSTAASGR
jgi:hypothetical protein